MTNKSVVVISILFIIITSGCSGFTQDITTVRVIPKVNGYSVDSAHAWLGFSDGYDNRPLRVQSVGVDFRYPLGLSGTQRTQFIESDFCFRNTRDQCVFQANSSGGSGGGLWLLAGIVGVSWLVYELVSMDCPIDDDEVRTRLTYAEKDRYSKDGCTCVDASGEAGYECYNRH